MSYRDMVGEGVLSLNFQKTFDIIIRFFFVIRIITVKIFFLLHLKNISWTPSLIIKYISRKSTDIYR